MRNVEAYSNLIYLIVRNGKKEEHRTLGISDFDAIDFMIDSLGPRKSFIVKNWFALNREKKLKMRELATIYKISIASIAEFKENALRDLREESKVIVFKELF